MDQLSEALDCVFRKHGVHIAHVSARKLKDSCMNVNFLSFGHVSWHIIQDSKRRFLIGVYSWKGKFLQAYEGAEEWRQMPHSDKCPHPGCREDASRYKLGQHAFRGHREELDNEAQSLIIKTTSNTINRSGTPRTMPGFAPCAQRYLSCFCLPGIPLRTRNPYIRNVI